MIMEEMFATLLMVGWSVLCFALGFATASIYYIIRFVVRKIQNT